uniref:Copper transport protein n=1 Tax=Kalanchoe fedtschenkoi TaxID=63787 RepID=A0A7N0TGA7_KALFE
MEDMKMMNMGGEGQAQMTFYWGRPTDILIRGWPGESPTMYALALITIFLTSVLIEWLSHARLVKPQMNDTVAGLLQTLMYAVRTCLAYLVMLAVMSFNVGIFVAAIGGYGAGFMIFGSRVFKKSGEDDGGKPADLPPFTC